MEAMQPVQPGWDTETVQQQLGPPWAIESPDITAGPTEVFQQLGFNAFDFVADRDLDEVWVYKHDRRGRFKLTSLMFSFVGIRDGVVTGVWQHSRRLA